MGWGSGNIGGGSGGLNFKVVAYATESELLADTPKENTIGIITSTPITSYAFYSTEPASPEEGMVWVTTGTASGVEFNALGKNILQVYPLSAKQYVSGAWIDVTAKSYQGGEWVDWWNGELYDSGNEFESVTGGWRKVYGYSFSLNLDHMSVLPQHGSQAAISTEIPVDTTGYRSMVFEFSSKTTNADSFRMGVCSSVGASQDALQWVSYATHPSPTGTDSWLTVSVAIDSAQGEYYPVCYTYDNVNEVKIYKIWME